MEDLIKAINSNDLVKFKKAFTDAMEPKITEIMADTKREIAKSVMIDGEDTADCDDYEEYEGEEDEE